MKTKNKRIRLSATDVRHCLRDLEILVVSFDRLGSALSDDPERLAIETDKFLTEVHAFKALARMRRILSEAYDSQSSKRDIQKLESWLDKVKVWGNK